MHKRTLAAWQAAEERERADRRASRWSTLLAAAQGLLYPARCLWRGTGGYRWPS